MRGATSIKLKHQHQHLVIEEEEEDLNDRYEVFSTTPKQNISSSTTSCNMTALPLAKHDFFYSILYLQVLAISPVIIWKGEIS